MADFMSHRQVQTFSSDWTGDLPFYTRPSRDPSARDRSRRLAMITNLQRLKVDFQMCGTNAATVEAIINYLRELGE